MPDNTIDTLSIDIKANSSGASKAINNLITNLTKLNGALNNYSDASQYTKALSNLQSGLKDLNSAIANIDTGKLKTVSSSISSLSSSAKKLNGVFNNIGLDKATRDAKSMDDQIEKATKDIMSFYGTSKNVADSVAKSFKDVLSGTSLKDGRIADLTDHGWKAFNDLFSTISRNAKKSGMEGGEAYYQELVDYMRGKKIPVHLPFDWSDIAGDVNSAKSQLATVFGVGGWSFNSKSNGDISEFVGQMNDAIGTQFDTSSDTRAFEDLYNALSQARRELNGFSQATTTIDVDMEQFIGILSNAVSGVQQFESQLSNANTTASVNPFSAMADELKNLQGINIPNLSGVADLAGNIGKLANKKASVGIQLLPTMVSGLQSLNQLQGIQIPDLTGLADLISVMGKLGGKKGSAATANLQPMISGLRQLSQLGGLTFPDSSNLLSLANAFSTLGRATTTNAIQNIPQLATAFRNLMQTLSTAPRVSSNVINLANALARLSANGSKVGSASRSLNSGMQRMSSTIDSVMARSKAISSRIIDFGKSLLLSGRHADSAGRSYSTLASKIGLLYAKFWVLIRAVKSLNGMIEVASALTEVQNVVDTTFGNMSGKLEEFSKNAIKDFGMSELSAKQYASQFQAMGTAMGITGAQVKKATEFISTKRTADGLVAGYNEASNSMADMSINLTKLAADMASFYDVEQSTVAKALQSGVMAGQTRPLRTYGLDLTQATLKEWALNNGLNANIKSMSQAEKTMLRYQYVLANTTNAQGDFSRTADTWHNQIVLLKQQLQQLAAVIGSGLIQAIKPFVMQMNAALSGLVKFAQNVVNALGKIFGWEMEVNAKGLTLDDDALDVDTSGLDDITDSADDATKATKKLKDQLQGFDKLNVLRTTTTTPKSKKSDSGSGTGAGAGGVADGDVTSRLKKTKGLFESNIDNLFDLGRYISDSLAKQLEGIKWDKIYEKASNFGKGLAEFLNGLITPRLFADVGRTIASSINTAFHFLDSFGTEFDWSNFGISIGTGLNAFMHNLDWTLIKNTAKTWASGLATTINEAVSTTSFTLIGETLANALDTALTFAFEFGSTIQFDEIGQKIADGINGFFENFPAKKFADTIDVWVQGIFDLVVNALSGIEWTQVRDKIVEFISNLDFKTIAIVLGGLSLVAGASFSISIGSEILTLVSKKFTESLAAKLFPTLFADGTVAEAIGDGLGGATLAGISTPIALAVAAFATLAAGLAYVYATNEDVRKGFENAVVSIKNGLQPAIMFISNKVVPDLVTAFKVLQSLLAPLAKFLKDVFTSIWQDMINPALTFIGRTVIPVLTDAFMFLWNNVLVPMTSMMSRILRPVIEAVAMVLSSLWKNVVVPLAQFVGTVFSETFKALAEIFDKTLKPKIDAIITVMQFLTSFVFVPLVKFITTSLVPVFHTAFKTIGTLIGDLKKTFSGLITFITGVFTGDWRKAWDGVKTAFSGIWDGLKTIIKSPLNAIMAIFEGVINGIISGWNSIKTALNGLSISIPSWVPIYGGQTMGFNLPYTMSVHLPRFAKGGFPDKYSYFMAGENGKAEMLGTVGGKTAVAGNQEITGIRDEIYSTGNRQIALLQKQNELLSAILAKEFGISKNDIFSAVRDSASDYTMRTGRSAFEF